ncbi:MAG TPA: amino acid deaminase/aldolase [Solirubrobacteraceae bacterium]|jgi:D-serine deaminase-like pyridoxal phosphate-dependent protein
MSATPSQQDAQERGRTPRTHPPASPLTRADAPQKDPQTDLQRLEHATADLDPPFALVDLDALWENAHDLERRAAHRPIRLASKSVRCRVLQERVLARDGFAGTLSFTLPEALWLARHRFEDIVVAYPTADRAALRELARLPAELPRARVTIMVDDTAQLEEIDAACGGAAEPIRVCIDFDAGYRALGGRIAIGAKRSPVHTPAQALALARAILARDTLQLVGIMSYEAHIAGLGDAPRGRPLRALAIRALQSRSARELAARRAHAIAAVRELAPLEFVNAGGTGSLHLTAREPAVTELTAGSGLYGPALFDAYRAFTPRPAALFALPVVRRPGPRIATVLGGGYLASGPADAARLPVPHLPAGLRLDSQEGAGEVQTPLLGNAADDLAVGDRVWMRHAKAGELCERFASLHLLSGDRIVEEVPTYRGEGQCFL